MDFPGNVLPPLFIHSCGRYSNIWVRNAISSSAPATATDRSPNNANLSYFCPIWLPHPYMIRRAFCPNGSVVAGNIDIGVYSPGGTRLFSTGSTAQAGTSTMQYINLDAYLMPGSYYLAIAISSTSAMLSGGLPSNYVMKIGGWLQHSGFPLPASATFASYASSSFFPLFGVTMTPSGF
jgi:hypothetical protein